MRRHAKAPSAFTFGRKATAALALATSLALALICATGAPAAKVVDSFFPTNGAASGAGGSFNTPRDIDVNDPAIVSDGTGQSSWIYVADSGNNRIQAFDSDGDLQFAIGADVIATGTGNGGTAEVQTLTVKATSGSYTLSFGGETTDPIAWNASASTIEGQLNGLDSIGGVDGSVDVTGPAADVFTITFGDALGGFNVGSIDVDASGLGIPVGTELTCSSSTSSTTTSFQWLTDGSPSLGAGANTATYTVDATDAGKSVQCQVSKTSATGSGSTQVSNPRQIVSNAPTPAPPLAPPGTISSPSPTGPGVGTELTCDPKASDWTGVTLPFEYQWYKNGVAIPTATNSTYTLVAGDSPATFQCAVIGSNASGKVAKVSQNRNTATSPGTPPGGNTGSPNVVVEALTKVATTTQGSPGFEICEPGGGDVCKAGVSGTLGGTFNNPQGIAIDQADGSFYVRDTGNQRVQQFGATGAFIQAMGADVDLPSGGTAYEVCTTDTNCKAGASGAGAGSFASNSTAANGIAVSPVDGHVFVADPGNRRLSEFDPDAADGGDADSYPDSFVRSLGVGVDSGSNTIFEACTTASTCQGGINNASASPPGYFDSNTPTAVGVDSVGTLYANGAGIVFPPFGIPGPRAMRFDTGQFPAAGDATGSVLPHVAIAGLVTFDVDPTAERLYVARGATDGVEEYDLSQEPPALADTHMVNSTLAQNGLAHNATLGTLYASSNSGSPAAHRVYVLDDDGAAGAPDVTLHAASNIEATSVDLKATVNPQGYPTSVRFQTSKTGLASDWQNVGPGPVNLVTDDNDQDVEVSVTGLDPNSLYRFRVAVTRGFGNGTVNSGELTFATDPAPPLVETLHSPGADDTSAYVYGTVNPQNTATSWYFEYGTTTSYGKSIPAPAASAGSGINTQTVSQQLTGLIPNTTYHYRLVADNGVDADANPGNGTAVFGADRTFATLPTSSQGPDGRAYELVSPAVKANGTGLGQHASNSLLDGESGVAPVVPSRNGQRYIGGAIGGPVLLGDAAVFVHDRVLGERVSDQAGWRSHSAFTRRNYCADQGSPFLVPFAASANLDLIAFLQQGRCGRLFEEIADWNLNGQGPQYVSDFDGNWDLISPTEETITGESSGWQSGRLSPSSDGSSLAFTSHGPGGGPVHGLLGPADPSLTYNADVHAAYLYYKPTGPSDTFAGRGPTDLLGRCSGSSPDRTMIPSVDGGKQSARVCPDPVSPASEAVIDPRGSSITTGGNFGSSIKNLVSTDGARAFFMSPDADAGADAACSGSLDTTLCPRQLYVHQRNADGTVAVRWLSRTAVSQAAGASEDQDASLMAGVRYEGASADGDKVFFRTTSPLTADDRNGSGSAPPAGGVVSGSPGGSSVDLYMYDMPNGPDGDPSTADNDPAAGTLTRISSGPDGVDADSYGDGDCNVLQGTAGGALRFASEDGSRAYFTCQDPLPGVPGGPGTPAGGITSPGAADSSFTNLYLYDANEPVASDRWNFVARIPRSTPDSNTIAACASTSAAEAGGRTSASTGHDLGSDGNCVRGTADGSFITFWTDGQLTADDPEAASGDIYAYDAAAKRITRISAAQGGSGGTYTCKSSGNLQCNADPGFAPIGSVNVSMSQLGVATRPATPNDRIAFFESRGKLVPEDTDNFMDTYQWKNGVLSLVSAGVDSDHAHFSGNDVSGRDVFFVTRQRLTWQDVDAVRDAYDARVGGGIPEPLSPPVCDLLADACQGATAFSPAASAASTAAFQGAGNFKGSASKPNRRCAKGKVRRGKRCVAKRRLAQQRCAKRKGAAKRRCIRNQVRRLNRAANHNRRAAK